MDRINNLPNELICHILSFLKTKETALTSVLSKRWQNLFALVPSLDIDDYVFLHPGEGKRGRDRVLQNLIDFMVRVLALQGDSPIEKLSLTCKIGVDGSRVNQWISNVLQRVVSYMDLFLDLGHKYELPLEIFVSHTLVKLRIIARFSLHLRGAHISLPMLKTLVLEELWIYDGQLQMILSACPVLEELDMLNIRMLLGNKTISSASLKTLTIDCDNCFQSFSLDTPNLVRLNYTDSVAKDYPLVNLENLAEAQINLVVIQDHSKILCQRNDDTLEDNVFLRLGNVKKFVRGIFNLKKLYLSPGTLQALALCCQAIPVFNNLTLLDIESSMDIAWQAMPVLLRNCPNLETLVIKGGLLHCVTEKCGDACICIPREDKGRSLVSCPVKRLEIRGFDGLTRDLEMIKHFLECFPCLTEMEIYIRESRQRFTAPLIPELNSEMLMRYNDKLGRRTNIKIKVHGSFPWERSPQ